MFSELSNARSVTARALSVLDAFGSSHRRQTLASMAKRANLPQSTTHRFLNKLVEAQALIRCSDDLYEIGSKLWRIGLLASLHADLREIPLPYMEDIFELGVDVVQIVMLEGMRCMVV
jgi:DNA-binding IclR family transcriptional regulator